MGAIGAGVVGPVFYGWIFDSTGSYDIAIFATLSTILVTAPLIYMVRDPRKVAQRAV